MARKAEEVKPSDGIRRFRREAKDPAQSTDKLFDRKWREFVIKFDRKLGRYVVQTSS